MELGYGYQLTGGEILEIDDAYNTDLKITTYNEEEYYLVTRTKHGYTSMLTIGPIPLEGEYLGKFSSINYKKFASSSQKIKHEIGSYINDSKKSIQIIEEIPHEDLVDRCKKWDLLEYISRDER